MALVKCSECGGEVSTKAMACPKCGAPVPQHALPAPVVVAKVAAKSEISPGQGCVSLLCGVGVIAWIAYCQTQAPEPMKAYSNAPQTQIAEAAAPETPEWTKGGTLHKATVAEWNAATAANRLATAADVVFTLKSSGNLPEKLAFSDWGGALSTSTALRTCVDAALLNPPASIRKSAVSQYAAACILMMGDK
jgi:hypothetical protein